MPPRISRTLAVVSLLFCAAVLPTALAQRSPKSFGVALRAGTYGVGADVGIGVNRLITVRGSYQTLDVNESFDEDGIDYDADLEIGGTGLYVDVFPFAGSFRITGGLIENRNEVRVMATPTEAEVIGDTLYTPDQIGTLTGFVDYDSSATYLGVGVGNLVRGRRFGFVFDAGLVFQDAGDVTLASSTGLIDPGDLELERLDLQDDADDLESWPVISFGLAIRF
ncbi:hypothetical protein ABI59_11285 [Acidobacteria bacterium Mor1]|nr:hypothetical protein ABI59_11285 [Acidobacteria bacterium Mor1]